MRCGIKQQKAGPKARLCRCRKSKGPARAGPSLHSFKPARQGAIGVSLDFSNAAIVEASYEVGEGHFQGEYGCEGGDWSSVILRFADRESWGLWFPAMRVSMGARRRAERWNFGDFRTGGRAQEESNARRR